ncbi:hypothetical protein ACFW6F_21805 [Streptomyces sp. NPDC058746]|uniref:hypothetical protein n=1 Tax=Streptomyces sp. NPDC058746 TaxID=3346622 RepID=UPI0036CAC767
MSEATYESGSPAGAGGGQDASPIASWVQTLAAAGELQRDLQRELTYDGLRAAEAKGNKGGRRPAITADKTDDVRTAYLEGRSIAALAREHDVSRGAIRTAVADLLPDHTAVDQGAPDLELPVTLDMPGKVADFLCAAELEPTERAALDQGVTVRRGQGYTLRISAIPAVHRQLLDRCQPLDNTAAIPAQRKARREYANRVSNLDQYPRSSRGGILAYLGHAPDSRDSRVTCLLPLPEGRVCGAEGAWPVRTSGV